MRGKKAPLRVVTPDRNLKSIHVTKLINNLMYSGKKSIAENTVFKAIKIGTEKINKNSKITVSELEFFEKVMEKVTPSKKVVGRRVGGSTYQVPKEIEISKRPLIGIKLIVKAAREAVKKNGDKIYNALLNVLVDAYNSSGSAVEKKKNLHDLAEKNAAFQHFKW